MLHIHAHPPIYMLYISTCVSKGINSQESILKNEMTTSKDFHIFRVLVHVVKFPKAERKTITVI